MSSKAGEKVRAFCEGSWTVILRRGQFNESEVHELRVYHRTKVMRFVRQDFFNRSQSEYRTGFGSDHEEYWIGLDFLIRQIHI